MLYLLSLLQPHMEGPPRIFWACCSDAASLALRLCCCTWCPQRSLGKHQKLNLTDGDREIGLSLHRCLNFVLPHSVPYKHPPSRWEESRLLGIEAFWTERVPGGGLLFLRLFMEEGIDGSEKDFCSFGVGQGQKWYLGLQGVLLMPGLRWCLRYMLRYVPRGQRHSWCSGGSIACGHSVEGLHSRACHRALPVTGLKMLHNYSDCEVTFKNNVIRGVYLTGLASLPLVTRLAHTLPHSLYPLSPSPLRGNV